VTRTIAPEARFAKHRLLPEIGPRGQERLSAARFAIDPSDPAQAFASLLLERSGLVRDDASQPLVVSPRAAREPALAAVDDAIRGAVAAVQRIREIVALAAADDALGEVPREDAR
jgi:hypothetical protein